MRVSGFEWVVMSGVEKTSVEGWEKRSVKVCVDGGEGGRRSEEEGRQKH